MNQDKNCFTQVGTRSTRRRNPFPTAANSLFAARGGGGLLEGIPTSCQHVPLLLLRQESQLASSTAKPDMEQQLGCSLRPCPEQQLVCSAPQQGLKQHPPFSITTAGFVAAELELLPVCSSAASNQERQPVSSAATVRLEQQPAGPLGPAKLPWLCQSLG